MIANYCRFISLLLLAISNQHSLIFLSLSLYLSGLSIEQVVILSEVNKLTKERDYTRRYLMLLLYAAVNLGAIFAFITSFIFHHYNISYITFLTASLFPIISNYIYAKHIKPKIETQNISIFNNSLPLYLSILASVIVFFFLFENPSLSRSLLLSLLIIGFVIFLTISLRKNLFQKTKTEHLLFIIYYCSSVIYFSIFYLNNTLLYDLIPRETQIINPQIITLLDPITAISFFVLVGITIKKIKQSKLRYYVTPIFFTLSFIIMQVALHLISIVFLAYQNKTIFFLFYVVLLTVGEVIIAPEGLSLVGRLLPAEIQTYAVALWRTFIGLAFLLSTLFTDKVLKGNLIGNSSHFFSRLSLILVFYIVVFSISRCFWSAELTIKHFSVKYDIVV